jgi:hypothetical protein
MAVFREEESDLTSGFSDLGLLSTRARRLVMLGPWLLC